MDQGATFHDRQVRKSAIHDEAGSEDRFEGYEAERLPAFLQVQPVRLLSFNQRSETVQA